MGGSVVSHRASLDPYGYSWPLLQRDLVLGQANPGIFIFSILFVPDWAPGPVQMCRDRRDIPGRALKVGFGRAFVENVNFSSKFRCPSATYPFFGPLIHEYLFTNASTSFVMWFSFCSRSSNLFSVSQSLPNHEFFKTG